MLDVDVDRFIADCAREVKEGNIGNAEMDENKRDNMIKEAEAAKARMLATPDKNLFEPQHDFHKFVNCQTTVVDQNYIMMGSNIDEQLCRKIINHEYIDFTQLLPKDRLSLEKDNRMELVNKGGITYFVPVSDREVSGLITGFNK